MNTNKQGGFSLVEMLVVVGILGIIAAIALPSYNNHVRDGRVEQAKSVLLEQVQILQREYGRTYTYRAKLSGIDEKTKFFDIKSSETETVGGLDQFVDPVCQGVVVKNDTFCLIAKPLSNYTEEKRVITANHLGEIKLCAENKLDTTCKML